MFSAMLKEAEYYEEVVAEYLKGEGFAVQYVGDKEEYWSKDIDFRIMYPGCKVLTLELKADHRVYSTGNIFVEAGMDRAGGYYPGWFEKCEADVLCYHDVVQEKGYFIDWKKMQREIEEKGYKKQSFINHYDRCTGYMYLVQVDDLAYNGWLIEEYSLK